MKYYILFLLRTILRGDLIIWEIELELTSREYNQDLNLIKNNIWNKINSTKK